MLAPKCREPGQQHIAAQVGGRRDLQQAAQFLARLVQLLVPLAQGLQYLAGVGQVALALGRETQAAGGAGEQADLQLTLQPLDGRADLAGQQIGLARGFRKSAQHGGALEQRQVIHADHFHSIRESVG